MDRWLTIALLSLLAGPVSAGPQGVRDRTRPDAPDTVITEDQAVDLTLTLTEVAPHVIQTWVRTAGTLDEERTRLTAFVKAAQAGLVQVGQRVRAFPPESISSIYQARVTAITPVDGGVRVTASMGSPGREQSRYYVTEILTEHGSYLSIPNEAIIEEGGEEGSEEGGSRVVYVQAGPGHFVPREIHTGLRGELYTEVLDGLTEGEQVVTFGSFFIDAEYKLNSAPMDHDE